VQTGAPGCAGDNPNNFPQTRPLQVIPETTAEMFRGSLASRISTLALKDTTITEGRNPEFRWEVHNGFNP